MKHVDNATISDVRKLELTPALTVTNEAASSGDVNDINPGGFLVDVVIEPVASDVYTGNVAGEIERAEASQELLHQVRSRALRSAGAVGVLARRLGVSAESDDIHQTGDRVLQPITGERRYTKEAPLFNEIVEDVSRTTEFTYTNPRGKRRVMTEHDGLVELRSFLGGVSGLVGKLSDEQRLSFPRQNLLRLAETQGPSMEEHLTFIGEPEYKEAVEGISERWKQFLRDNPDATLCAVAVVAELERYKQDGRPKGRKSDDKLREDVIATFNDNEIAEFGARILGSVEHITDPGKVRIVMLDDWSISGEQMQDVYRYILGQNPVVADVLAVGNLELNLLTASNSMLERGLLIDPYSPDAGILPVYSYFRSHEAPAAKLGTGGHVSGLHSSVNWDFSKTLSGLQKVAKMLNPTSQHPTIGLSAIQPAYRRQQPKYEFTPTGVKRIQTSMEEGVE